MQTAKIGISNTGTHRYYLAMQIQMSDLGVHFPFQIPSSMHSHRTLNAISTEKMCEIDAEIR